MKRRSRWTVMPDWIGDELEKEDKELSQGEQSWTGSGRSNGGQRDTYDRPYMSEEEYEGMLRYYGDKTGSTIAGLLKAAAYIAVICACFKYIVS